MTVGELIDVLSARDKKIRSEIVAAVKEAAGKENFEPGEEFVGVKEAARIVRRSPQTVYRLSCYGEIPRRKHRGRLLFSRKELDEWAKGQRVPMKRDIEFEAGKYMRR